MADLVTRLRCHAEKAVGHWEDYANSTDSIVREAADEIEQLRDRAETAVVAANALQLEVDRYRSLYPAPQKNVRVKPLEWEQVALDSHEWNWLEIAKAETPFGTYSIQKHTKGFLRVMFGTLRVSHFELGQRAEAEASAQGDLEARIQAALAATATDPLSPSKVREE